MSEPVASITVRKATPKGSGTSGDQMVCAFNEMRTELVSTLAYILGNKEDAQDAAQDAFLKCWRNRAGLPDVRNLRGWIFRVGINAAKDLQRNAWRRRARPLAAKSALLTCVNVSPSKALEEQESRELLRNAILGLRTEEREVYLLRENGNLTYEEIAKIRSAPVGTVKTQMRAAIAKLRQVLQEK